MLCLKGQHAAEEMQEWQLEQRHFYRNVFNNEFRVISTTALYTGMQTLNFILLQRHLLIPKVQSILVMSLWSLHSSRQVSLVVFLSHCVVCVRWCCDSLHREEGYICIFLYYYNRSLNARIRKARILLHVVVRINWRVLSRIFRHISRWFYVSIVIHFTFHLSRLNVNYPFIINENEKTNRNEMKKTHKKRKLTPFCNSCPNPTSSLILNTLCQEIKPR